MKKNLSKVVIPTLTITLAAALAGSISGTVAWYQYSTRANVGYIGQSVGASGNLHLRIKDALQGKSYGGWKSELTHEMISEYLKDSQQGQEVQPMTFGAIDKDGALPAQGYLNPRYGDGSGYTGWRQASENNYVTIPLQVRYGVRDGHYVPAAEADADTEYVAEDVYLSDLLIQADYRNTDNGNDRKDISDAVRVHIHSNDGTTEINRLISKKGGTTVTHGRLDINGDGEFDSRWVDDNTGYGFDQGAHSEEVHYGVNGSKQVSYSASEDIKDDAHYFDDNNKEHDEENNVLPAVVHSESDSLELTKLTYKDGDNARASKKIGTTVAGNDSYLEIKVTIWIEGWQKFEIDDEYHLELKRVAAKNELKNLDVSAYRDEQKDEIDVLVDQGITAIDAADTPQGVATALKNARKAIAQVKNDEELDAFDIVKDAAKAELDAVNLDAYDDTEKAEVNGFINTAKNGIDNAATVSGVEEELENARKDIAAVKTSDIILAEATEDDLNTDTTDENLVAAKDAYKADLDLVDVSAYSDDAKDAVIGFVGSGKTVIDAANSVADAFNALVSAKESIAAEQKDAIIASEASALAAIKTAAKNDLDAIALDAYRGDLADEILDDGKDNVKKYVDDGKDAIDAATSFDGVIAELVAAKESIAAVKKEAQLVADEESVSSIWNGGYVNSFFDVGFQFGVQDEYSQHNEAAEN